MTFRISAKWPTHPLNQIEKYHGTFRNSPKWPPPSQFKGLFVIKSSLNDPAPYDMIQNLKYFEKYWNFFYKKSIFFQDLTKTREKSLSFLTYLVHFSRNFRRKVPKGKVLFETRQNDPATPLVLFMMGFISKSTDPPPTCTMHYISTWISAFLLL